MRTNQTETVRTHVPNSPRFRGYSRKSTGSNERSLDFLRCQVIQQPIAKQFLARRNLLTLRAAAEMPRSGAHVLRSVLSANELQWGRG